MSPRESLARYPLFALLPDALREAWLAAARTVAFSVGETIFCEGSPGDWVYLVLHGRVRVLRITPSQREVTLGLLGSGEMFGEYALLAPGRNTATCRAASDAVLLQFSLGEIRTWLHHTSHVASRLKCWLQLHFLLRHLRDQCFLGFMSGPSALAMLPHLAPTEVAPLRTVQADGLCDDQWLYIQSGEILLSRRNAPAQTLGAGDSLGESALVGQSVPTAVALTTAQCLALPRVFFQRPNQPAGVPGLQSYASELLAAPERAQWIGQKEASDCGVACLAMIARYHGLPATQEQIRDRVHVGNDGATLGELGRVACELGFSAQLVRVGTDHLRHVHVPAIAHLRGDHYVVLFRLDASGSVLLGDPATGMVTVSLVHFIQRATGNMLLLPRMEPSGRLDKPRFSM